MGVFCMLCFGISGCGDKNSGGSNTTEEVMTPATEEPDETKPEGEAEPDTEEKEGLEGEGEHPSEETPDAEIEGENYSLAGKTFGELDVDVQQELLRFKFQMFAFEDCTDDMIEEIFFRLNNSTPLTKPQKSKPLM